MTLPPIKNPRRLLRRFKLRLDKEGYKRPEAILEYFESSLMEEIAAQSKEEVDQEEILATRTYITVKGTFSHGTEYAWSKKKCRCEDCHEWHDCFLILQREKYEEENNYNLPWEREEFGVYNGPQFGEDEDD